MTGVVRRRSPRDEERLDLGSRRAVGPTVLAMLTASGLLGGLCVVSASELAPAAAEILAASEPCPVPVRAHAAGSQAEAAQRYLELFCTRPDDAEAFQTALARSSAGILQHPHLREYFIGHAARHDHLLLEVLFLSGARPIQCGRIEEIAMRARDAGDLRAVGQIAVEQSYCVDDPTDLLEQALELAEELDDGSLEVLLRRRLGFVHFVQGRNEKAIELLEGTAERAHREQMHFVETLARDSLMSAYLEDGRVMDVLRMASTHYAPKDAEHDWNPCRSSGELGAALVANASFSAGLEMLERSVQCARDEGLLRPRDTSWRTYIDNTAFARSVATLFETSVLEERATSIEVGWALQELARIGSSERVNDGWLARALAAAALANGRIEQASSLYRELVKDDGETSPRDRLQLELVELQVYLLTGRSAEAVEALAQLDARRYPGSERLRLELLARANESQGNHEAALALRREIALELMPALQTVQATLVAGTSDPELLERLNEDLAEQARATLDMGPGPSRWVLWVALTAALLAASGVAWSIRRQRTLKADSLALGRATQELETSLRSVSAEVKRREREIASLAHDLRNPLTVIVSGVELAQSERSDSTLDAMGSSALRMRDILNSVVESVRSERSAEGFESIDLSQLLRSLVSSWQTAGSHKRIDFDVDLEERLFVGGRVELLSRVFDNLLSNAVKYSSAGGRVEVSGRRDGGRVRIVLRDQGEGIDAAEIERVFQPFAHISSMPTAGEEKTGLGLFSARAILEQLGGELQLRSDGVGQGTTVIVEMPADTAARDGASSHEATTDLAN